MSLGTPLIAVKVESAHLLFEIIQYAHCGHNGIEWDGLIDRMIGRNAVFL